MPGAERLGRHRQAGEVAEQLVHVLAAQRVLGPLVVDPLEQLLAGEVAAAAHEPSEARVLEGQLVPASALAGEAERHRAALDHRMAVAKRREAVRAVLTRVGLVADPHHGAVEQRDRERRHDLGVEPAGLQVRLHPASEVWQRLAERDQVGELLVLPERPERRVVPVLLARPCIPPGRLEVPGVVGTDPDVRPRRRHGEGLDPGEGRLVPDRLCRSCRRCI